MKFCFISCLIICLLLDQDIESGLDIIKSQTLPEGWVSHHYRSTKIEPTEFNRNQQAAARKEQKPAEIITDQQKSSQRSLTKFNINQHKSLKNQQQSI